VHANTFGKERLFIRVVLTDMAGKDKGRVQSDP